MIKFSRITIFITLLIIVTACTKIGSLPEGEMPDIGVAEENMDTQLQILVPKEWNNFKIGEEVSLAIRVLSTNQVAFQRDFGARIFIYENNKWVEVDNSMRYDYLTFEMFILNSYENNPLNEGTTSVVPKLPNMEKTTFVRIFLVGMIYRDGQLTDDKTAAHTDVILKP